MSDELLMTERAGVWMPAPPPAVRLALLNEAEAVHDREVRKTLVFNGLGLILVMSLWPLAANADSARSPALASASDLPRTHVPVRTVER